MTFRGGKVLLFSSLAIVLFQSCPIFGAQESADVSSLQAEAIRLYRSKSYGSAIPLYRQLAQRMPDNPDILEDLAWTLWYAEHYGEAAAVASRLTILRP